MDETAGVRKMYSGSLRKSTTGSQTPWSEAELLAGLQYYQEVHGRFPKAHEIDAFEYLPSSRSIQRTHGGLVALRSKLLPAEISNFTKGSYRSERASKTFSQGRTYEEKFYDYLITQFAEISVHEHKPIRPGRVNCDFFLYLNDNEGVVIDVFYAGSIINWVNVVNIKLKRYSLITPETYLVVVGNSTITQQLIDEKVANRRLPLPPHIHIATEEYFSSSIAPRLQAMSQYSLGH